MVGTTSTAPPPPPPPPPRASAATAATVAPRTQPVPVHGTLSIWSGLSIYIRSGLLELRTRSFLGLRAICQLADPLPRPPSSNRLLESARPEPVKASAAKQTIRSLLALQAVDTGWPPLANTEHAPWLWYALPCMLSSK